MKETILFSEKQKFTFWWVWLFLIAINGIVIYGLISQMFFGIEFGNKPTSNEGLILIVIFILSFTGFFLSFKLQTEIKDDGIYVRFFPLHIKYRFYSWNDIAKVYVRTYKPLKEYGGWGIKGRRNDKAFNLSGKEGLQLELKDGNKLLIGTRKSSELNELLIRLKK